MRYFNSSVSFQLKLATFVSPKLCAHSAHFRLVAKENGQRKETCGEVRKVNGVSGWRILSSSNCQANHAQVTGSRLLLYVKGEQEDGGRRERKQLKAEISPATREAVGRYVGNLTEAVRPFTFPYLPPSFKLPRWNKMESFTSHPVLNYPNGTNMESFSLRVTQLFKFMLISLGGFFKSQMRESDFSLICLQDSK